MSQFFPAFNQRRKFARDTGNVYQQSMSLDLAEIIELYSQKKYRADIRLFSNGKILQDVRLPGPYYTKEGQLHGQKSVWAKNQLILVGYVHGRAESPIVIQGFPFGSGDINQDNLEQADYDPDTNEIGHESGHRFSVENEKQTVYDKEGEAVFTINFSAKEISIAEGWKLKVGAQVELDDSGVAIAQGDLSIEQGEISIDTGDVTVQKAVKPVSLGTHTHPVAGQATGPPS